MEPILHKYPLIVDMLDHIETACHSTVENGFHSRASILKDMLIYHMGWAEDGNLRKGKRIRPLLLCLSTHLCGGDWHDALPAASAVELIHNFSLIHDDIQDQSPTRHGQPTLWKLHGIAQAINAGDALFSLALNHIWHLSPRYNAKTISRCSQLLTSTCLQLTEGQYLDLYFEKHNRVTMEDYQSMIEGKTTALLATSTKLGAMLATPDPDKQALFHLYGYYLGLAFQVMDDYLGIWGDEAVTGKSTSSDLVSGKLSYPVILGIERNNNFALRWAKGNIQPVDFPSILTMLDEAGVPNSTLSMAREYTDLAFVKLRAAVGGHPDCVIAEEITDWLINRNS